MTPFPWFVAVLCRWMHREQDDLIAFLREENRVLKAQLRGRRLRLSDHERRRLAAIGHRLGRRALRDVATIATPDTILRWHRDLVIRQWKYAGRRTGRPRVQAQIRSLTVRMAMENATWGYTRIQGALKNLGHQVGRSTIARILKEHGVPPSGRRPIAWRTFVRAHWPALIDLFRTEVPTIRGGVTYCAAFIIGRCSRRVYRVGSTSRTNEQVLLHRMPQFTSGVDGLFSRPQSLRSPSQMMRYCGPLARVDEGPNNPGGELRGVWAKSVSTESAPLGSVIFDGDARPWSCTIAPNGTIELRCGGRLDVIYTAVSEPADGQPLLLGGRLASRTNIRFSGQ